MQQLQTETLAAQAQAQKTLQANARVSQALLDKATTTAANLHAIIDEAAVRYKQTPGFYLGGTPSWVLCVVALIILGAPNSKFAVSICFLIFGKRR